QLMPHPHLDELCKIIEGTWRRLAARAGVPCPLHKRIRLFLFRPRGGVGLYSGHMPNDTFGFFEMTAPAPDRLTHLASRLPSPSHAFRRKTPDRRARRKFARRWIAGFFSVCRLFLVRRLPRAGRTSIQLSVLLPMARDAPHAGKPVCTNFVL